MKDGPGKPTPPAMPDPGARRPQATPDATPRPRGSSPEAVGPTGEPPAPTGIPNRTDLGAGSGRPRPTGPDASHPEPSKTGRAAGGAVDAIGKKAGASQASRFVKRSDSAGGVAGDAKSVAGGVKDGAAIGAKVGGGPVGAAVGGAIGGAVQGLKTKNGRRYLLLVTLGPAAVVLLPLMVMLALVSTVLPSVVDAGGHRTEVASVEASEGDGISRDASVVFHEAGLDAGIPREILAALAYVHAGGAPVTDTDDVEPLTEDEAAQAVADNAPVGPLALLAADTRDAVDRAGHEVDVAELTDLEESADTAGDLLRGYLTAAAKARTASPAVESFDLSVGTVLGEAPDDNAAQVAFIDGYDPSEQGLGTSTEPNDSTSHHEALRAVYLEALDAMPVDGMDAERVFDVAIAWHLGRSAGCTGAAFVSSGTWANPIVGPITSPYGMRFHPVLLTTKLHDGVDVGMPTGTPVHAAGSGTAIVGGSDASWAGPNAVLIDHGNGVATVYGHMSAAVVADGDTVQAGQPIGKVGSEGYSTGAHLHFTVRVNGQPTDPEPFMASRGVEIGKTPIRGTGGGIPDASYPGNVGPGGDTPDGPTPSPPADPQSLEGAWAGTSDLGEVVSLDGTQLGFAAQVAATGGAMGVSDDGIVVAFMTMLVEGRGRNYASTVYPETIGQEYPAGSVGSDHDSVGLFQQRPQAGWGGPMQLLDPAYAASAFFGGPQGPNGGSPRGLLDIPGWEVLPKGDAAQAVQVSAHPDRYAAWEAAAVELLGRVKGGAVSLGPDCAGMNAVDGYTVATFNASSSPDDRFTGVMAALAAGDVSVAALQGVSDSGRRTFDREYTDVWGSTRADRGYVVWRRDRWREIEQRRVFVRDVGGSLRSNPFVLLEQRATGERIWFMGAGHTGSARDTKAGDRERALRTILSAVAEAGSDGYPVFVAGGFDDSQDGPTSAQCILTPTMTNAFGSGGPGPCGRPDTDAANDHIFATEAPTMGNATADTSLGGRPLVTATVGAASATGNAAVDWALAQEGKGYSQAQDLRLGPTHYDCSGLTHMAWQQAGVQIPLTSRTQAVHGQQIDRSELQPGDLIFYYSPVSHVSMYVGERNGEPYMVHAANPRTGVEVVPLSHMAAHEVGYRRVG